MTKLKIAYFDFVTHIGGAPRSNAELCARLSKKHDVVVYDVTGEQGKVLGGFFHGTEVRYEILHPRLLFRFVGAHGRPILRLIRKIFIIPGLIRVSMKLRKCFKKDCPDIVILSSMIAARMFDIATVGMQVRNLYFVRGFGMQSHLQVRRMIKKSDGVMALTDRLREHIVSQGIPQDRVFTCHNAFETELLTLEASQPLTLPLPELQKPARVLVVASLITAKGQDCAIRAIKKCKGRGLDVVLYLAGDLPEAYPISYVEQLQQLACDLGVQENVAFLGWRNDIRQILAISTMMVLPSHTEGLPRSIMEAMILGCPVAATPVGGVPDLIRHGETGWLFNIDDDQSLADCIIEAHNKPERTKNIVENAHQHIKQNFSVDRQVESFEMAVRTVLKNDGKANTFGGKKL